MSPSTEAGSSRHAAWLARSLGRDGLAPLRPDDLSALVSELDERHYPAGAALFRSGEPPVRVHIVRKGAVGLSRQLGERSLLLGIMGPGYIVGDVPVFLRRAQVYDARAVKDSLVLSIDSVALFRLLEQQPRLARLWHVSLAARLAFSGARLVQLLPGELEARVAAVLLCHCENGVVHLSQQALAELVGGRRTSVNRVLRRFESRDAVRLHYGRVEILDEQALLVAAGWDDPGPVRGGRRRTAA